MKEPNRRRFSTMKSPLILASLIALSGCSGVVERREYALLPVTTSARTEVGRERALEVINCYLLTHGYQSAPIELHTPTGVQVATRYSKRAGGRFDTFGRRGGRVGFSAGYSYVPPFGGVSPEFHRVEHDLRALNYWDVGFTIHRASTQ